MVPLSVAAPLVGAETIDTDEKRPPMYELRAMAEVPLEKTLIAPEPTVGALGAEIVTLTGAVPAEVPPALVAE